MKLALLCTLILFASTTTGGEYSWGLVSSTASLGMRSKIVI